MTTGHQGNVDDPEVLPCYMEAFERGLAGTRKRGPRNDPEGDDVPCEDRIGYCQMQGLHYK